MVKTVDNKPIKTSDNVDFEVAVSLYELEEMLDQRLSNKPKGEKSEKQWKKDINKLAIEINSILGFNKLKKV